MRRNDPQPRHREKERNRRKGEMTSAPERNDNEPIMERIHVISRGKNLAGDSFLAQKAYAR